jgi:hypothetical protein
MVAQPMLPLADPVLVESPSQVSLFDDAPVAASAGRER